MAMNASAGSSWGKGLAGMASRWLEHDKKESSEGSVATKRKKKNTGQDKARDSVMQLIMSIFGGGNSATGAGLSGMGSSGGGRKAR